MPSELYRAVVNSEDIHYIRALIDSEPSKENLNSVEPNGTTALHEACRREREDLVLLFVHEFQLNYYWRDKDGRTAHDVSSQQIRSLFPRHERKDNPFCTGANAVNPIGLPGVDAEVNTDGIDDSTHWLTHPHQSQISTEVFHSVVARQGDGHRALFSYIASWLGFSSRNEKLDKWVRIMRYFVNKSITNADYLGEAHRLLSSYHRSENIEDLFTLYTLDQSFTKYLAQRPERTAHFFAPIDTLSYTAEARSFQGHSYRGLTMTDAALNQYKLVQNEERRFVQTKTFCSSSTNSEAARMFSGADNPLPDGFRSVLITFNFDEPTSLAIKLYEDRDFDIQNISHFADEKEVLILPGTNFRVTLVDETTDPQVVFISLDHYNTDEEAAEANQDRFQSYLDTFFTD